MSDHIDHIGGDPQVILEALLALAETGAVGGSYAVRDFAEALASGGGNFTAKEIERMILAGEPPFEDVPVVHPDDN